jgi:hypothetical protein
MAANVVSCPGCDKKYRIPADSEASEFQCTACGETIVLAAPEPASRGRARSGGARDRRRGGRGRAKSSNAGIYMACGILGLAAVVAVVVVLMTKDNKQEAGSGDPRAASGAPDYSSPAPKTDPEPKKPDKPDIPTPTFVPDPDPEPDPEPRRPDKPVVPDKPVKKDISTMDWDEISNELAALEHVPGTAESLKSEINKLVTTMLDFQSGGDGLRAQKRLIEIGKPAVPIILRGLAKLGFKSIEDRSATCMADEALREITNYTRIDQLRAVMEDPRIYRRVVKRRMQWWESRKHLEGAAFPETVPDDDEEDDEEDDD